MKLGIISSPNLQDSSMTRLDLMKSTANPKEFGGGGTQNQFGPLFLFPVYCFILTFDFQPQMAPSSII
jgi:hypothetical protein